MIDHDDGESHCPPISTDGAVQPIEIEPDYETTPPTVAILTAIGDHEGVPPTDLEFTLHDYIDGDALARLFDPARRATYHDALVVTFQCGDYQVEVRTDGPITIEPPADSG